MHVRYFSAFSGIGGFELGLHRAWRDTSRQREWRATRNGSRPHRQCTDDIPDELTCVGFSEIDRNATTIYDRHFNHHNYGDISAIDAAQLADFDLLVGGFPCQAFSIAGLRRGFQDTRGTLFFDLARIIREKQPRFLFLENVKGLLSHDDGRTFKVIVIALDELGYDLQWQVLNSKNFGVPQNRERVFLVGHLRGTRRPQIFPLAGNGAQIDVVPRHIANTLIARYQDTNGTYIVEGEFDAQTEQPFIRTENLNGKGFNNTYSGTLRSGASHNYQLVNGIRRLTPIECERLQGFPDNWTEGVSDTNRYKCLGNAVTVNVIAAIATRLFSSNRMAAMHCHNSNTEITAEET